MKTEVLACASWSLNATSEKTAISAKLHAFAVVGLFLIIVQAL